MAKQHRLMIVAQAPGGPTPPPAGRALEGSDSLRRLAGYAGLRNPSDLYEVAHVVNLIEQWPGKIEGSKYDDFPIRDGVAGAVRIKFELHKFARVVLLGGMVRESFTRAGVIPKGMGWFDSTERWRGHKLTVMSISPHPSGVSQFWNDHAARAAGEAFWRQVISEAQL